MDKTRSKNTINKIIILMPRSQRNDNFIDKTFTVIADILLKVLPTSNREKQAFSYYRDGMSAQSEGEYAEALQNYYEALRLETDAYDRSYILYNIGLINCKITCNSLFTSPSSVNDVFIIAISVK